MPSSFIDSVPALTSFLDGLPDCKGQPPSLYVDLEGNNLSRHGTLSLVTILVKPQERLYLIDVTTLKRKAFEEQSSKGFTLKGIFESNEICKVFFDIRNDSDALYSLYDVRVRNVEDLQLQEFASRDFQRRFLNGLAKCIERDSKLDVGERSAWNRDKEQGRKLFDPACGGSYDVFDQRPLSPAMIKYCEQDVLHMPHLRELYLNKLCDAWYVKIMDESRERIRLSQTPHFDGKGRHMAMGPSGWGNWQPGIHERHQRTLFHSAPTRPGPSPTQSSTAQSISQHEAGSLSTLLRNLELAHDVDESHSDGWNSDSYADEENASTGS